MICRCLQHLRMNGPVCSKCRHAACVEIGLAVEFNTFEAPTELPQYQESKNVLSFGTKFR